MRTVDETSVSLDSDCMGLFRRIFSLTAILHRVRLAVLGACQLGSHGCDCVGLFLRFFLRAPTCIPSAFLSWARRCQIGSHDFDCMGSFHDFFPRPPALYSRQPLRPARGGVRARATVERIASSLDFDGTGSFRGFSATGVSPDPRRQRMHTSPPVTFARPSRCASPFFPYHSHAPARGAREIGSLSTGSAATKRRHVDRPRVKMNLLCEQRRSGKNRSAVVAGARPRWRRHVWSRCDDMARTA
jgi:hypothetical protein